MINNRLHLEYVIIQKIMTVLYNFNLHKIILECTAYDNLSSYWVYEFNEETSLTKKITLSYLACWILGFSFFGRVRKLLINSENEYYPRIEENVERFLCSMFSVTRGHDLKSDKGLKQLVRNTTRNVSIRTNVNFSHILQHRLLQAYQSPFNIL